MRRVAILVGVLAFLGFASRAGAAWDSDGNPVVRLPGSQHRIAALPFGDGGVLVVWMESGPRASASDLYAMALTRDGNLAPGWPDDGLPICRAAGHQRDVSVIADGQGGACFAWVDERRSTRDIYVQRVTAAGTLAPGWPEDGLFVARDDYAYRSPGLASDGEGGLFVSWLRSESPRNPSQRLGHITGAGEPAPGWPEDGLVVGAGFDGPLLHDGAGGVFVAWIDWVPYTVGPRLVIRRFTAGGAPHAGWPLEGAVISNEGPSQVVLLPDGADGVFAAWTRPWACPLDFECWIPGRVIRLDAGGGRAPGWPETGIDIGPVSAIALDGAGGLVNAWTRTFTRVTRVGGDATPRSGWIPDGNPACSEASAQYAQAVVGDGAGGAFVMWIDYRSGVPVLYQSRLTSTGALAPGWPTTGSLAARGAVDPEEPWLVPAGPGRAIAVWVDSRDGSRDVFAKEVIPGPPGPPVPIPPKPRLGIARISPNPTRGPVTAMITVTSTKPATLELIDLAGRVIQSRRVEASGPGSIPVTIDLAVPGSGLYWLRFHQGGEAASARVMVVR